ATATRVTATLITPLSDALSMPPLLGSGAIGATEPWRGRERPWPTARPTDPLSNKHRKRFALSASAGRAANCCSYCGGGRVAKPRLPQAQRASPIRTVTFLDRGLTVWRADRCCGENEKPRHMGGVSRALRG